MLANGAQRHFFDKTDVQLVGHGVVDQGRYFAVVAAFHHHHVQFDVLKARVLRGGDAGQHLIEFAGAGDGVEFFRVQAIQADVQAFDPCRAQSLGITLQL